MFTATLTGGAPGGLVLFIADGTLLGYATTVDVGGVVRASLTTSALSAGVHVVSAVYAGGSGFASANAGPIGQLVQIPGAAPVAVEIPKVLPEGR